MGMIPLNTGPSDRLGLRNDKRVIATRYKDLKHLVGIELIR